MFKGILSVALVVLLLGVGYFADDGFKGKVNGMFASTSKPTQGVAQQSTMKSAVEVVASVANSVGNDNTYAKIVNSGVVKASVQAPSKPFYYVEGGSPKGFNVEFMSILFSQPEFRKGKTISIDTSNAVDTYPDVPKQLLKGTVDIAIDGLTFSDEDLAGVVYSIPYVKDFGYSLITAKVSTIKTIEDASGKRIGVLKGDPDAKAFAEQSFPNSKIVELSDAAVDGERSWIYNAINTRKVDAMVYDYPFAVAEIDGTNLQFAIAKIAGSNIQYKIGVRKNDVELLAALNSAIKTSMDTPEYNVMLKKYFASNKVAMVRAASSNETVYVVKAGDTLSTIAQTIYGNKMRYREIETRNNLPNPNLISVAQKLVIPK